MVAKSQYSKMHKPQLVSLLESLDVVRESLSKRYYEIDRKRCIAIPLCADELRAVKEYAGNYVCSYASEGRVVDSWPSGATVYDIEAPWRDEPLLPQFCGLLVRYSYESEAGTDVMSVWGLLEVR